MADLYELAMDRSDVDEEEFSPTELAILDELEEGRATPAYLADALDREQPYIRNRLGDLVRLGLVERVHRGLYELATDGGEVIDEPAVPEDAGNNYSPGRERMNDAPDE
jgi:predicted transcriptional regulator